MIDTLEVLNGTGHLSLKWDPADPEDVARARAEVDRLKAAGYTFYAVVDGDPIVAGDGDLRAEYAPEVERIADPIRPPEAEPRGKKGRKTVAVRPMAGG